MDIKNKTIALIDALKATCQTYGMGNDGNEYKIITQIFLYKFINDKFGFAVKQINSKLANAEKWELEYEAMSEDDRLDLLDELSPDIPRLHPQHLISFLWNQQAKGDFDLIFDSTMIDIANVNMDIFATQTTQNTKIPLFEKLTQYVTDEAQRAPFASGHGHPAERDGWQAARGRRGSWHEARGSAAPPPHRSRHGQRA